MHCWCANLTDYLTGVNMSGVSAEEFVLLQQQLITLKTEKYEAKEREQRLVKGI
jgi:hypothetical protein